MGKEEREGKREVALQLDAPRTTLQTKRRALGAPSFGDCLINALAARLTSYVSGMTHDLLLTGVPPPDSSLLTSSSLPSKNLSSSSSSSSQSIPPRLRSPGNRGGEGMSKGSEAKGSTADAPGRNAAPRAAKEGARATEWGLTGVSGTRVALVVAEESSAKGEGAVSEREGGERARRERTLRRQALALPLPPLRQFLLGLLLFLLLLLLLLLQPHSTTRLA